MNLKMLVCLSKDPSFTAIVSEALNHRKDKVFQFIPVPAFSELPEALKKTGREVNGNEINFIADVTGSSVTGINQLSKLMESYPASVIIACVSEKNAGQIKNSANLVVVTEEAMIDGLEPMIKLMEALQKNSETNLDIKKGVPSSSGNDESEIIAGLLETIQAKEKLFSLLSHDLKDPLLALSGITEILFNDWKGMKEAEKLEIVEEIMKSARKTYQLVNNISAWSKSITKRIDLSPQVTHITDVLIPGIELAELAGNGTPVKINNEIDTGILLKLDKNLISTVFRNLLINAVKNTPAGGIITLSAEKKETMYQFCIANSGNEVENLCVRDLFKLDPSGSSPEKLKAERQGIGLLFCKEFVEKNGGRIWLESNKETGTKFYFTVPY